LINRAAIISAFMLVWILGCLEVSAQSFQPLSRKYQEPQHVTPEVDSLFLQAIGLRTANTVASAISDGEFNILLVGKDFQGGAAARVEAMRAGHLKSKALSSRADAVMVLSFRARDRKVVLHTFYRGMKIPAYCTRYDTHSKLASSENYLANYFTHVGRRFFIPCVEKLIQSRLLANSNKLPLQVGNPLGFKIDAFMEIDLDTFNVAAKEFRRSLGQYGMVMAAFQRLAPRVAAVLQNLVKVRKGLRLRHIHKAGGYQRSFNIAKFVGTALGYVAYATASEYHDTIFQVSTPFYNAWFSRSMTMEEVRASLLGLTPPANALWHGGYSRGASNVMLIHWATSERGFMLYTQGKAWKQNAGVRLNQINTRQEIIPGTPDCLRCGF
jgi:hypothetical protein